ncbi:type II toxin-antitoxin system RelE/ParE family toxin [Hyphomonas sp.]|uniref:type II toxin-antitoxin system RelE/ParE family toxin n=1 Tax=Hyphomonas sp. TaxID=87 RepID=UPI003D27809C
MPVRWQELFALLQSFRWRVRCGTGLARPVRVRPFGAHLVVYELKDEVALVLRIRHSHEDWTADYEV